MRKSFHTLFVFVLGIFIVSGLSYFYSSTTLGLGTNPPIDNTPVPINESSKTQGRCVQSNTAQDLDYSKMHTNCSSGAKLFTNGIFVKGTSPWAVIYGDPNSTDTKQRKAGLFVGCASDTSSVASKVSSTVRALCGSYDKTPEAYFNGDIIIDEFNDGTTTDRPICLNTSGKIIICP
jgi:hypothetical protein